MILEYSSNNSGGSFWLSDEDWKNMEDAGWKVQWGGRWFCNSKWNLRPKERPAYLEKECSQDEECPGHPAARNFEEVNKSMRWLGALATNATIETDNPKRTIREWEDLVSQDSCATGCSCCGPPHDFSWRDEDGRYHYHPED